MSRFFNLILLFLVTVPCLADRWVEMSRPVTVYDFDGHQRRLVFQAFSKLRLPPDAASYDTLATINELHVRRIELLIGNDAFDVQPGLNFTPHELQMFVDHHEKLTEHDEIVCLREVLRGGHLGQVIFMMAKSYRADMIGKNFHVGFQAGDARKIRRNDPASQYPEHWTRGLYAATEAQLNAVSEIGGVAQMNAYITTEGLLAKVGMRLAYDIGFLTENEVMEPDTGKTKRVVSKYLVQETWSPGKERLFKMMGFGTIQVKQITAKAYEAVLETGFPFTQGTDIPNKKIPGHTIRIGLGATSDLIATNVPEELTGIAEVKVGKATSFGEIISTLARVTYSGSKSVSPRKFGPCRKHRAVIASAYVPSHATSRP